MTTISSATYDPATTATQLATASTSARQANITQQTDRATSTATALGKLGSALSEFSATLAALSAKKSLLANSAVFSDAAFGTATASATAAAGTYSFFVEQLATAHQISYGNLTDTAVRADNGSLKIMVGTSPITVSLNGANKDGDAQLSAKEIAAAINAATNNNGKVVASILTVNGIARMVLNAGSTGASAIAIDASAVADATLQAALTKAGNANYKEMTPAQDAIVWLDGVGGTKLQQASNTFSVVDGVTMNFTKAQATGDAPVTMTVASDAAGSATNITSFVDAYNKLQKLIAGQTYGGNPAKSLAGGAFANDAGVDALKSHLAASIRTSFNGMTLAKFGITASRDGVLSVNSSKLTTALAANPTGLDQVFGSASAGTKSGVMGELDKFANQWNNSVNGQIVARKTSASKQQSALVVRQAALDTQYNSAYKRYLAQFTTLQSVQAQMTSTTTMFDAMFK